MNIVYEFIYRLQIIEIIVTNRGLMHFHHMPNEDSKKRRLLFFWLIKKEKKRDYERWKEKKTLTDSSIKRQYRLHKTRLQVKRLILFWPIVNGVKRRKRGPWWKRETAV